MKLTTAIGLLAQTIIVAASKAWEPQNLTDRKKDGFATMKRKLQQISIKDMLKRASAQQKRGRRALSASPQRRKRQGSRRLGILKNNPYEGGILSGKKMCNVEADTGILACPPGEACIAGHCHPETAKQNNHHTNVHPLQINIYGDPASAFCDPTSQYYYDFRTQNGFDSCDCTGVDLATGTGTFTCSLANYCFDPPYNNYCAGLSFDANLSGGTYFSYTYCYDFSVPFTQQLCYTYNTDNSFCGITVDSDACSSCVVADQYTCSSYYTTPDIAQFDCTTVTAGNGLAGDNCASYNSYYYATQLLTDATAAYQFAYYTQYLCNQVSTSAPGQSTDDGFFGAIFGYLCSCDNIDPAQRSFDLTCGASYTYGPYAADLSVQATVSFPAPGLPSYTTEYCLDFTAPQAYSYCYTTSSLDPYGCTLTINNEQCSRCYLPDPTICNYDYDATIGYFDCVTVNGRSGDGCVGDYASPFIEDFAAFQNGVIIVDNETVMNLVMDIFGIMDLSASELEVWIEYTELFIEAFFASDPDLGVFGLDVEIDVIDTIPAGGGRRELQSQEERDLQTDMVTVIFDETLSYMAVPGSTISPETVASLPFSTAESREDYVQFLQAAGLEDITGVTDVMVGIPPTPAPIRMKKGKRGKKSGKKGKKDSKKNRKSSKSSKRDDRYYGKGKGGKGKGGKRR